MPKGVIASTHSDIEWQPRHKDIKRYVHFDRAIDVSELRRIANDPARVASHSFFPLLRFYDVWTKFRKDGEREKKVRPLRYASRVDAAIYARYRSLLSERYENELAKRGLGDVPVAYRRIPNGRGGNKSNIEIARDVFNYIKSMGDVVVTVVDVRSYFESLDHGIIKSVWSQLMGGNLPPDHLAVFNSLNKYSVVDLERLFERLQIREKNSAGSNRKERRRRNLDVLKANRHKQICSAQEFRSIVAGGDGVSPSLIQKNGFDFGIPQGTPISDIVANFYLLDFDKKIADMAVSLGGIYRRYSDDIILVLPKSSNSDAMFGKNTLQNEIKKHGRRLRIQDKKVCVVEFSRRGDVADFSHIFGKASRNGLEYLGFCYDGRNVKIKNSTLSNAWRKVKRRAIGHASRFVKRYRARGKVWMINNYPFSSLETVMLRDVTYNQDSGYDTWTFVKYMRRSSKAFVGLNPKFSRQTKKYRKYTQKIIANSFGKALDAHC